jgi:oligosaccharyl transferase (archaeosortase A-associated)
MTSTPRQPDFSISIKSSVQIFILAVVAVFMLWVRLQSSPALFSESGYVRFPSADAWYHKRTTIYTVQHFPRTLPFDPFTAFPRGNYAGQFGTLYDQLLAGIALLLGLGDPSTATINAVLVFTPPVIGVLTIAPIFGIAREVSSSWGGVLAVVFVGISSGLFLQRSVAGFTDHHVLETFLTACILYFLLKAIKHRRIAGVSRQDHYLSQPVWVREAAAAGILMAAHLVVWPPGVVLTAILCIFVAIQATLAYYGEGQVPVVTEPLGGSFIVATITFTPFVTESGLHVTSHSFLQSGALILAVIGCASLQFIYQRYNNDSQKGVVIIGLVAGSLIAGVATAKIFPESWRLVAHNAGRVIWFIDSSGGQIGEAATIANPVEYGVAAYGFGILIALTMLVWIGYSEIRSPGDSPELVLVAIYTIATLFATMSQIRFDYYLVLGIVVLSGVAVSSFHRGLVLTMEDAEVGDAKVRAGAIVLVLLGILIGPSIAVGAPINTAEQYGSVSKEDAWGETLEWLSTETPQVGEYGGKNPSSTLNYGGSRSHHRDYAYKSGEYGILTRWSVGHRMTVQAHRIPVSNPHQIHATEAADTFLAANESAAIRQMDSEFGEGSGVQYVIVDDAMASGGSQVFSSAPSFASNGPQVEALGQKLVEQPNGEFERYLQTERSYRSFRTRLYQFHGSAARPSDTVIETSQLPGDKVSLENGTESIRSVRSSTVADKIATRNSGVIQGGLYGEPPSKIDALHHFRLVYASNASIQPFGSSKLRDVDDSSSVKVFERVPGATIKGTAPPNSTIKLSVVLSVETTGKSFEYKQTVSTSHDGDFRTVVPYATTGQDKVGVEDGVADSSVVASTPYRLTVQGIKPDHTTEVSVPEKAVIDNQTITIELNE